LSFGQNIDKILNKKVKICATFLKKHGLNKTHPSIYLYNILGWSSFPSIRPIIRPSKFLIPKEEDDGTGGRRRLMAAVAIYPHVHVILLAQFVLALRNCFCVVCRNLVERAMEGQQQQKPNGGTEKKGTSPKLPKRGDILWGIVTPKELKSKR
jgi:hypothetical protein